MSWQVYVSITKALLYNPDKAFKLLNMKLEQKKLI